MRRLSFTTCWIMQICFSVLGDSQIIITNSSLQCASSDFPAKEKATNSKLIPGFFIVVASTLFFIMMFRLGNSINNDNKCSITNKLQNMFISKEEIKFKELIRLLDQYKQLVEEQTVKKEEIVQALCSYERDLAAQNKEVEIKLAPNLPESGESKIAVFSKNEKTYVELREKLKQYPVLPEDILTRRSRKLPQLNEDVSTVRSIIDQRIAHHEVVVYDFTQFITQARKKLKEHQVTTENQLGATL